MLRMMSIGRLRPVPAPKKRTCVKNVRKALEGLAGVTAEQVTVGSAVVSYDPAQSSPEAITSALTRAGYPARHTAGAAASSTRPGGGHCGV